MQPLRPYEKMDTLKQFIDHDRHVLRFYCYWDDKENMFGDNRYLVLHYFLADDTIEILERVPANAGRDAVPMFLRRWVCIREQICTRSSVDFILILWNVFCVQGPSTESRLVDA